MQQLIGAYEIKGEIGRGGMGVVYLARDSRLDRDVAIKALPEDLASDPARLERFEREAKSLAQINHPNTATIHGVEEAGGARYLILELVEGESLADRLDRGAIATDEAIELAAQIAAGVEAAHEAGVIHRDLKPANIMITPDGEAKVLDFGLARSDEGRSSTGSAEDVTITTPAQQTTPGVVLGTAAYMSPEQARGRRVDKRTDIWSFGVVLYEMLVGASPFVGETATDSIGAVLHKDLDLKKIIDKTPSGVTRVLSRCLERDRNLRYRDIGDVRIELLGAMDEPETPVGQQRRSSTQLIVTASLIAAAAAGSAAWLAKPAAEPPRELRLSVAGQPNGETNAAQITPDGSTLLLYNRSLGRNPVSSVFLRPIDSHNAIEAVESRRFRYAAVSPDSEWISYIVPATEGSTDHQLVRQPTDLRQPPTPVAVLPESFAISFFYYVWLNQGRFLFDDSRSNLVRFVDAATGRISDAIEIDIGDYPGRYRNLLRRFDDTRALCVLMRTGDDGGLDVGILDTETATARVILENTSEAATAPDGSLLFTRGATLYGCTFDPETLETGPAVQLVSGLRVEREHASFSISDDGTLVFLPGGRTGRDRGIDLMSSDGTRTPLGVRPNAYNEQVSLSPDGSFLVTQVTNREGGMEIWGTEMDQPRMRRLRSEQGEQLNYAYVGPDNDTLVYMRSVQGQASIEVASIRGDFDPRTIVEPVSEGFIAPLSMHPDGSRVLVLNERPEGFRAFEVNIEGEPVQRNPFKGNANITWSDYSPDGTMLAYTSDETGQREVYVSTILNDGSLGRPVAVTTGGGRATQWRADPSRLAGSINEPADPTQYLFVYHNDRLDLHPVTPGPRPEVGEPVAQFAGDRDAVFGWGELLPDNRYITITRGPSEAPAKRAEVILNWYDDAAERIRTGR
ncbi:MAG: protein kinase [Planctomycetota bacterium]